MGKNLGRAMGSWLHHNEWLFKGGLGRLMGSFRKWKDLCYAGIARFEGGEGKGCPYDHSCTYDTYI